MVGLTKDGMLEMVCLGQVLGYDGLSHNFAGLGMPLEMCEKTPTICLRVENYWYPKWVGFRRMKKSAMVASYAEMIGVAPPPDPAPVDKGLLAINN